MRITKTAIGLILGCLIVAGHAEAQTCTPVAQRVTDNSSTGSVSGWTLNPSDGTGWKGATDRISVDNDGAGSYVMSQELTKVSGGAVLAFDLAWNNGQLTLAGGSPDVDGNQIRLTVQYGGQDYLIAETSVLASESVANVDPGPAAAANALRLVPGTGAVLLAGSMPDPFAIRTTWVLKWSRVVVRLPENIPQTGSLSFRAERTQFVSQNGSAAVDDLHIRNVTLNDVGVCFVKSTPQGIGTYAFTTTNVDVNHVQTGVNPGFSITTAGSSPVAWDSDSGVSGAQPALLVRNPVTVTESVSVGNSLMGMSCDNDVTATRSGSTFTLSNMVASTQAGLMVTCTVVNSRPRIKLRKVLAGSRLNTGDQFLLSISGPSLGVATTATATTTGSNTTVNGTAEQSAADEGATYTLSESGAGTTQIANYSTTYSCSNATAGSATSMPTGSGRSFTLKPAATDDITCTFTNTPIAGQPFSSCPVEALVTRGTALTSLNLQTGVFSTLGNGQMLTTSSINAIGFRSADGYIWGWYNNGLVSRLVRIGSDGVAAFPYSTAPSGMVGGAGGFSGDVDPKTGRYVVLDSQENHVPTLYVIDVETNTSIASIPTSVFANSTDFAFDKNASYLYSVKSNGEVFRVPWYGTSLGAPETLSTLPTSNGSGGWGAIFMDDSGTVYAYRSGSGQPAVGLVYRIFQGASGTWVHDLLVDDAATSTNLDGARCPSAPAPVSTAALLLRKTTLAAVGGPFGFTLSNASLASATVTTTAANTATSVDGDTAISGIQAFTVPNMGADIVVSESSLPSGWRLSSAQCQNRAGSPVGSLAGSTYTIPGSAVRAGELFTCDFSNARSVAGLSITKDNGVTSVEPGASVMYTLVVSNAGPDAANGAIVRDPAVPGLTCATAVCGSATGNAVCPSPSAVTVSALQSGSGVAIPSLPANSSVQFQVSCSVN